MAEQAIAAAEQAATAGDLREQIAQWAGLPPGMGTRLKGEDAAELADDAEKLAETLAELRPTAPPNMSDRIRAGAGRTPSTEQPEAEPAPTSFDGGARESGPPPPPSMNGLIRGERDQRAEDVARRAADHDRN